MIPPRQQWCQQIDVTNACPRQCSNCTRLLGHSCSTWYMTPETFAAACKALADFPMRSEPDRNGRRKVVGMIGGEPLAHPQFDVLVDIMVEHFPDRRHRGLWTGLDYRQHKHADAVDKLLGPVPTTTTRPVPEQEGGYLNQNLHNRECFHQPVLVAVQDVIQDREHMWRLIRNCPLQRDWAGAVTPNGYFFCEVAAAFDMVFGWASGTPVEPNCWLRDLNEFQKQIERWCPRCGVCLPLAPRRDRDELDDISSSNLESLKHLKSPRVLAGKYALFDPAEWRPPADWKPLKYMR